MLYLLLFLVGFLTDVCQCCETGYYSSNGECRKCPDKCASCSSASSCTSCNAGYYGGICSEYCPVYCHNSECNQISGQCLSCKEGYYNDGNNSCSKCPENCATCNSKQFCFTCISGYKGEYCQSVCSKCKPVTSCDKYSGYCQSDCVVGFSGELCDTPCNSKCKSCDRYKQHECISCAPDRYGPSCNEPCSRTCTLNTCDVSNGRCISGCIAGYWGENCEQICSRQCNNQVCYQSNGECKDGCIDGFSGIDCSTSKNSVSVAVIVGGTVGGVLIVCLSVLSFMIIRKLRVKWCNPSLVESIHHLLCTSDKTTNKPDAEQRKHLKKCHEDMKICSAQAREKANVKENIFQQITIESEKENTSRTSDVSISIERCTEPDIDELNASHDKQETLPLIHETARLEEKDKGKADKEIFNMTKPFTTHSIEKINTNTAENKPLTDTPVKKTNEVTCMDRSLVNQTEERDIVSNKEENKNARLGGDITLKTSVHENSCSVSKRPVLSSLKKDENDENQTFQGFGSNINNRVQSFDNNKKDTANTRSRIPSLGSLEKKDETKIFQNIGTNIDQVVTFKENQEELVVAIYKNMNIDDKPTKNSIMVAELAKYVANIKPSTFFTEYQSLKQDVSGKMLSDRVTSRTLSKVPRVLVPVVLEDTCKASVYINANFIDGDNNCSKEYIAYMGQTTMLRDENEVFWKVVLQERCSTVVMLGTRSLPEEKCTCTNTRTCTVEYNDITVECHRETNKSSFTTRNYTLKNRMMERDVQRLQFTGWPPYGMPELSSFVDFVTYANKVKTRLDGPTMVYCRSGIDCTGTYIALDILTKQGKDKGWVDIQGCVRHLLEQRENILYSSEQYEFIHKALVISLTS